MNEFDTNIPSEEKIIEQAIEDAGIKLQLNPKNRFRDRVTRAVKSNGQEGPRQMTSFYTREKAHADYHKGMSFKELSYRYHVSIHTIRGWISRYRWNKEKAKLREALEKKKSADVLYRTRKAQFYAEKPFNRTLSESEKWMDAIQQAKDTLQPEQIKQLKELIESWKIPIDMTRKTLGLDNQSHQQAVVNIAVLSDADSSIKQIGEGEDTLDVEAVSQDENDPI